MSDGRKKKTAGAVSPAVREARMARREPAKVSSRGLKACEHHGEWNTLNRWEKRSQCFPTSATSISGMAQQAPRGARLERGDAMRWALAESRGPPRMEP